MPSRIPVPFEKMSDARPGESSTLIRERVVRARAGRNISVILFFFLPNTVSITPANITTTNDHAVLSSPVEVLLYDVIKWIACKVK